MQRDIIAGGAPVADVAARLLAVAQQNDGTGKPAHAVKPSIACLQDKRKVAVAEIDSLRARKCVETRNSIPLRSGPDGVACTIHACGKHFQMLWGSQLRSRAR